MLVSQTGLATMRTQSQKGFSSKSAPDASFCCTTGCTEMTIQSVRTAKLPCEPSIKFCDICEGGFDSSRSLKCFALVIPKADCRTRSHCEKAFSLGESDAVLVPLLDAVCGLWSCGPIGHESGDVVHGALFWARSPGGDEP